MRPALTFIALLATMTAACGGNGRPTDAEIRKFAASRGVENAETSPILCGSVTTNKEKGETTIIRDTGEKLLIPKVDPQMMRYSHLCTMGAPDDPFHLTFVAKLSSGGKLVIANLMNSTDE